VDFRPFHPARSKTDGCVYAKVRKQYTRTKPIKTGFFKIKSLPREKCAIVKLTNLGYSINQLSAVFGRSTSYIHKCTRAVSNFSSFVDKRKLPSSIRLLTSSSRRRNLAKWFSLWEAFIFGEVDKPP
jgi:hypothetical protein